MALTVQANGTGPAYLVQASWWNDYHDLLTGVMLDQPITVGGNLTLKAIPGGDAPATGPSLAAATGTALGTGTYQYAVSFGNANGSTVTGPTSSITLASPNKAVNLSGIPLGPAGTTKRTIFRTVVNGVTLLTLVTINDNTTTTYTDTTPDGSLGSTGNYRSTFGGQLRVRDTSGSTQAALYSSGEMQLGGTLQLGNLNFPASGSNIYLGIVDTNTGIAYIGSAGSGYLALKLAGSTVADFRSGAINFYQPVTYAGAFTVTGVTTFGAAGHTGNIFNTNGDVQITGGLTLLGNNGLTLPDVSGGGGVSGIYGYRSGGIKLPLLYIDGANNTQVGFGTGQSVQFQNTQTNTLLMTFYLDTTYAVVNSATSWLAFRRAGVHMARMSDTNDWTVSATNYGFITAANGAFGYGTGNADIAEPMRVAPGTIPGMAVCVTENDTMAPCSHVACRLAKVVSTSPNILMKPRVTEHLHPIPGYEDDQPIAVGGIVPVRVVGKVELRDRITTVGPDRPGFCRKALDTEPALGHVTKVEGYEVHIFLSYPN